MLSLVAVILVGISFLIGIFLLQFYRDPKRVIPGGNAIVSPADGRVIAIVKTGKKEVTVPKGMIGKIRALTGDVGNDCCVVSIFMSPFDAHINRAPIGGKIVSMRHTQGKFFGAYDLEKSLLNEKNEIVIKSKKIRVKVIQIAGFLARRIIPYVKEGQDVKKGQKIGMIALGSQTTLIMPGKVKVAVKKGQRVKAGSSVIAEVR